jgi:hypothetical protein
VLKLCGDIPELQLLLWQLRRGAEAAQRAREQRLTGRTTGAVAGALGSSRLLVGYYEPDAARDSKADEVLQLADAVRSIQWEDVRSGETVLRLLTAEVRGATLQYYKVVMHPPRSILCSCLDFMMRGGYCKHLRAAHKKVYMACSGPCGCGASYMHVIFPG